MHRSFQALAAAFLRRNDNETIIKFISCGESGIEIRIEGITSEIKDATFYSEKSALITSRYGDDPVITYNHNLEEGLIYYIKINLVDGWLDVALSCFL